MGRRRRQEQERALSEALAEQRLRGRDEGRRQGFLSILSRIARRLFRLEVSEVARVIEREGYAGTLQALGTLSESWAERWRDSFEAPLAEIADAASVQTDRGEARLSFDLESPVMNEYFQDYLVTFSEEVAAGTRERVTETIREAQREGLSVVDTAGRIEALGSEFGKQRAQLVAQNELLRASKGASYIKARESGVISRRRYLTASDSRVRPEHVLMDGEERGLDEPYSSGEMFPGEKSIRCRCVETYTIAPELLGEKTA